MGITKEKCPACGTVETVEIMYGMPTHEAYEEEKRGEVVLGGCCIFEYSPTRHCKSCGQDFGGGDLLPLPEMTSFEFFVGGHFGTSHYVYINAQEKNKVIRYAKTPGGMYVDLKNPESEINLNSDIKLKEIPITSEQWLAFIKELTALEISCWKDKYYDNDICDGTQWKLVIMFPQRFEISKCGSNQYPPYWDEFIKILKKCTGENIG